MGDPFPRYPEDVIDGDEPTYAPTKSDHSLLAAERGTQHTKRLETDADNNLYVNVAEGSIDVTVGEVEIKNDSGNPVPVSGAVVATPGANYHRVDTYVSTSSGVIISCTSGAARSFGVLVVGTAAAADLWDVRLEGSLDGVNFTQIMQHTTQTGNSVHLWSGSVLSPSLYIRSRCATLTLGSASNIVVTILGS